MTEAELSKPQKLESITIDDPAPSNVVKKEAMGIHRVRLEAPNVLDTLLFAKEELMTQIAVLHKYIRRQNEQRSESISLDVPRQGRTCRGTQRVWISENKSRYADLTLEIRADNLSDEQKDVELIVETELTEKNIVKYSIGRRCKLSNDDLETVAGFLEQIVVQGDYLIAEEIKFVSGVSSFLRLPELQRTYFGLRYYHMCSDLNEELCSSLRSAGIKLEEIINKTYSLVEKTQSDHNVAAAEFEKKKQEAETALLCEAEQLHSELAAYKTSYIERLSKLEDELKKNYDLLLKDVESERNKMKIEQDKFITELECERVKLRKEFAAKKDALEKDYAKKIADLDIFYSANPANPNTKNDSAELK